LIFSKPHKQINTIKKKETHKRARGKNQKRVFFHPFGITATASHSHLPSLWVGLNQQRQHHCPSSVPKQSWRS